MSKDETARIISLISLAFPYYYKEQNKEDIELLINLWHLQFENEEYRAVYIAVQKYLSYGKYPPSIADIKDVLYSSNDITEEEAWDIVHKAGKNSSYHATEMYDGLPDDLKQIVTIDQLKRIAQADSFTLESIKRNFVTHFKRIQEDKKKSVQISSISDRIKALESTDRKVIEQKEGKK